MPTCTDRWAAVAAIRAIRASCTILRLIACPAIAEGARVVWCWWSMIVNATCATVTAAAAAAATAILAPVLAWTAAFSVAVGAHRRWGALGWIPCRAAAGWALETKVGSVVGRDACCVCVCRGKGGGEKENKQTTIRRRIRYCHHHHLYITPFVHTKCTLTDSPHLGSTTAWVSLRCTPTHCRRNLQHTRTTQHTLCLCHVVASQKEQHTIWRVPLRYTSHPESRMDLRSSPGLALAWLGSQSNWCTCRHMHQHSSRFRRSHLCWSSILMNQQLSFEYWSNLSRISDAT